MIDDVKEIRNMSIQQYVNPELYGVSALKPSGNSLKDVNSKVYRT
jgi:hypothetical protein